MAGIEAPFGSEDEARAAYYGSDTTTTQPEECPPGYVWDAEAAACVPEEGTNAEWGQLQDAETLAGGWVLAYQERMDGSQTRWFVLSSRNDTLVFLNSGGNEVPVKDDSTPDSWPSFPTEADARDAHAAWLEANPQQTDEAGGWSDWELVTEVPPWFIYVRTDASGNEQFQIAGERDGENVYLAPNATIQSDPYFYDSIDAVDAALVAYYDAVDSGAIPPEEHPSGLAPDEGAFPTGGQPAGAEGGLGGLFNTLTDDPLLVGGAAVAGLYFYTSRSGDSQ